MHRGHLAFDGEADAAVQRYRELQGAPAPVHGVVSAAR
jgi:hypothetical protein